MTPREHAAVWRKIEESLRDESAGDLYPAWRLASQVATTYEQSAKEQERHE